MYGRALRVVTKVRRHNPCSSKTVSASNGTCINRLQRVAHEPVGGIREISSFATVVEQRGMVVNELRDALHIFSAFADIFGMSVLSWVFVVVSDSGLELSNDCLPHPVGDKGLEGSLLHMKEIKFVSKPICEFYVCMSGTKANFDPEDIEHCNQCVCWPLAIVLVLLVDKHSSLDAQLESLGASVQRTPGTHNDMQNDSAERINASGIVEYGYHDLCTPHGPDRAP